MRPLIVFSEVTVYGLMAGPDNDLDTHPVTLEYRRTAPAD